MKTWITLIFAMLAIACNKWVDAGSPTTQISAAQAFATDATAAASAMATYSQMETDGIAYYLTIHPGRSADELLNYGTGSPDIELYNNNLTASNANTFLLWQNLYKYIYQANALLEGIAAATQLSAPVHQQIRGEAYFVRAFCHFYLVNLFGKIPIVKSTAYDVNADLPRNTVSEVYDFIKADLINASSLLSPSYLAPNNSTTTERTRPNQFAARALLARVYLYTGDWQKAETEASATIANTGQYNLVADLNSVFLKNSQEAIWQWQSQVPGYNTYSGAYLILTTTPSTVSIDTNMVNSFAPNDLRKSNWIKSISVSGKTFYYAFKYKVRQNASSISEYTMVLRLAEQYLIRAEARAMQDNLSGSLSDLNTIRTRAGLASLSGLAKQPLLDSIGRERKWELLTECGDRWINLNRTGTATAILTPIKGSNWSASDALYPIPQKEINLNNQLTQNPGY